jgi:hypothetical protein
VSTSPRQSCEARAYHVLAIQPRSFFRADEELAAVCVGAGVGHAENPWPRVGQIEVLRTVRNAGVTSPHLTT